MEKFGAEKVTDFVINDAFYYIQKEAVRGLILKAANASMAGDFDTDSPHLQRSRLLPRAHGSAIFARGETQAVTLVTLGTGDDAQEFDSYTGGETAKKFILHYNFPNFSVGETGRISGPGRREIGHGALAERSASSPCSRSKVIPTPCASRARSWNPTVPPRWRPFAAARLALMDAGVPLIRPVAGISIGICTESRRGRQNFATTSS